jgi:hypothetical protein
MSWIKDEHILSFDLGTAEKAGQLYALLNAVLRGTRRVTKVQRTQPGTAHRRIPNPHTVYITTERKLE